MRRVRTLSSEMSIRAVASRDRIYRGLMRTVGNCFRQRKERQFDTEFHRVHTVFHREDKWRFAQNDSMPVRGSLRAAPIRIFSVQLCVHFVKLCVELSFFFAARTRRTHNAAQPGPHPDHPHRQPAAPRRADRALRPPLTRRGDRRRRNWTASARRRCARSVAKQIAAGIDVGNNGEQQREAFFLYVRHRMSGFGGGWTRKVFADVDALSRRSRHGRRRMTR